MQALRQLRRREEDGTPVVVRGDGVVGVGHRDEIGNRRTVGEQIRVACRPAARRGEVVGRRHLAPVEQDLALRVLHRLDAARRLRTEPAVDLAPRVGVEHRSHLAHGESVGAGGHCLGFQRGERPVLRHLARHDPANVRVDPDDVHRLELLAHELNLKPERIAPVHGRVVPYRNLLTAFNLEGASRGTK